uniref:Capsule synthesis protein CapA domain-containing protein n=1 Tax=Tetradesmus obliquus TaxID=3088 RepID=A0A383VAM1_TETOB|eukprot:jgi/Sobl393_1/18012/SZX62608.1
MDGEKLNLVLLGDIMLGRYVDDEFELPQRKIAAFGDVLPLIHQYDPAHTIVAGNLECAVTRHAVATPKAFNFKLHPSHAGVLTQLGLGYVSLANNHVLDYGQEGLAETHEVLDALGVAHSGSGTLAEAAAPAFVIKGGYKVAFLSYSDHYEDWAAGPERPGINFIDPANFKTEELQQQVAAARAAGADLVLGFVHWGPNWRWRPDGSLQRLGRTLLAAGADLVFGHSAHHIQGVQVVHGRPIIYGAGGFIDDYATEEEYRNDLGCVWVAEFSPAAAAAAAGGTTSHHDTAPSDGSSSRDQHTAGSSSSSSSSSAAKHRALQLQSLRAVPTRIHHDWREGVRHSEPGCGSPPYVSQVDLAHGAAYEWVAAKLAALSAEWGTAVVPLPHEGGLLLLGQGQQA